MNKYIWLPDTKTQVIIEPDDNSEGDMHKVKIWDSIVMERKKIDKNKLGFEQEKDNK